MATPAIDWVALRNAANEAATKYFNERLGGKDALACGFAWVVVNDVKLSSKLGKEMAKHGFSKEYGGGISIWNPSKLSCQNVDTKESGAQAYAKVLKDAGFKCYAASRLD
jgi:hypothetical protein